MENITRKNFFSSIGKGIAIAAVASSFPAKIITRLERASNQSQIKIKIHPFAVNRNDKGNR